MDPAVIDRAIAEVARESQALGIKAKRAPRSFWRNVKDLTGGASLDSNIQLVYNCVKSVHWSLSS